MDFAHNINWYAAGFCLALFLLGSVILKLITNDRKYLARRWMVTKLWSRAALYIVLTDGAFAKTPAALMTIGVAGAPTMIFIFEDSHSLTAKLNAGKNSAWLSKGKERIRARTENPNNQPTTASSCGVQAGIWRVSSAP